MAKNYIEVVQQCWFCHKTDKVLISIEDIRNYNWNYTHAKPHGWHSAGWCSKYCFDRDKVK